MTSAKRFNTVCLSPPVLSEYRVKILAQNMRKKDGNLGCYFVGDVIIDEQG